MEGLFCAIAAKCSGCPLVLGDRFHQKSVVIGVCQNGYKRMIFGGSTNQGRAADIDKGQGIEQIGVGQAVFGIVEIDDNKVDGQDVFSGKLSHVLGIVAPGENAGKNFWVQCLDPAIKQVASAGVCSSIVDRYSMLQNGFCCTGSGKTMHTCIHKSFRQRYHACGIRNTQKSGMNRDDIRRHRSIPYCFIFLRKVLRLIPKTLAALLWLP